MDLFCWKNGAKEGSHSLHTGVSRVEEEPLLSLNEPHSKLVQETPQELVVEKFFRKLLMREGSCREPPTRIWFLSPIRLEPFRVVGGLAASLLRPETLSSWLCHVR